MGWAALCPECEKESWGLRFHLLLVPGFRSAATHLPRESFQRWSVLLDGGQLLPWLQVLRLCGPGSREGSAAHCQSATGSSRLSPVLSMAFSHSVSFIRIHVVAKALVYIQPYIKLINGTSCSIEVL